VTVPDSAGFRPDLAESSSGDNVWIFGTGRSGPDALVWNGSNWRTVLLPTYPGGPVAVGSGGAAVSIALAAACPAIAAGLLGRATIRPALLLSVLLALAIWVAGENFGGLFTGQATDPSSGPLLILLAAAYWPASRAHAAPASPRPGVTLATHSPAHGGGHGHGRTVAWAGRDARGRGPAAGRG
jgi:hypothetical protein